MHAPVGELVGQVDLGLARVQHIPEALRAVVDGEPVDRAGGRRGGLGAGDVRLVERVAAAADEDLAVGQVGVGHGEDHARRRERREVVVEEVGARHEVAALVARDEAVAGRARLREDDLVGELVVVLDQVRHEGVLLAAHVGERHADRPLEAHRVADGLAAALLVDEDAHLVRVRVGVGVRSGGRGRGRVGVRVRSWGWGWGSG